MRVHNILIVLSFIFFIVFSECEDPELYKCSNQLKSDNCFLKGKEGPDDNRVDVNYVKPCPIGQTCVISGDSGICVDIKEKVSVGGECKSSGDCKRGLCTNNICTPIEDGENCQDDKSCKGGSSCSSNK